MLHVRRLRHRKRLSETRILSLVAVMGMGWLSILYSTSQVESNMDNLIDISDDHGLHHGDHNYWSAKSRHLLQASNSNSTENFSSTATPLVSTTKSKQYPPDIFSLEDRKKGAVVLHCIGLIYMFVALAIVCDEFFVPSLGVITDKLLISDDVAGATFMAAGGSAPELFTSIIGVFIANSNVGISTIVGSAVFNILFVIGMCAVFSHGVLHLTWWPLFRDVLFYSVSLIVLILCFRDSNIEWFESLSLLSVYALYVIFMKFNATIERFVKQTISRNKVSKVKSQDELRTRAERRILRRQCTLPILRSANTYRHGALQLMIHTIDPISERDLNDKAVKLQALANKHKQDEQTCDSKKDGVRPEGDNQPVRNGVNIGSGHPDNYASTMSIINSEHLPDHSSPASHQIQQSDQSTDNSMEGQHIQRHRSQDASSNATQVTTVDTPLDTPQDTPPASQTHGRAPMGSSSQFDRVNATTLNLPAQQATQEEDDIEEPLDLSWPKSWKKRLTYVVVMPIVFPLWVTLPDVRRPEKRKWFPCTFLGSIFYIAIYSYLMVWWANQICETMDMPDEVMGLTVLAAGTSIPDLITSVIVARKGLGDMAVSSSVGSNIFDITVGLPFPWILYAAIYSGSAVDVNSEGLFCSILLLFGMLMVVIITIAANRWKMTKILGMTMFFMYIVFLTISVLLECKVIRCSV
ncbi:sodium/potassium/calcium exchanger 2-like [Ptychodera flava]|uniref:sodium/potassium/calcium exchanger 2-like n=1 Tax=Ptychodera flava TaxID=63121 RepID=UPI00396A0BDF